MPYISSPQDLREQFVQLPDNVRKWLASEKVLAVVSDMNDRLEYFGDKVSVIPWLITRLAVKDLAPKYFMSELRDYLVVDENEARAITEEIDKRILRPIEPALNRLDIDLNSLYLGQAAAMGISDIRNQISERGAATTPTIGAREQFGIAEKKSEIRNQISEMPIPEGPVMLHTEKEEISQIAHEKPGEATSAPRQSFSINIPQSKYKKPAAPPPVTVRIETPAAISDIRNQKSEIQGSPSISSGTNTPQSEIKGSPSINSRLQQASGGQAGNNTPPKIMKVVHYSDFRTLL